MRKTSGKDPLIRLFEGKVSGSQYKISSITIPIITNSQKIICQEVILITCPPNSGPAIGAIAIMIVSVESICAARVRLKRSRIIARAIIGPVHAPNA